MNKINYDILINKKTLIEIEKIELKTTLDFSNIEFIISNKFFNFDYLGLKIIKTNNTNKFIRNLLNDQNVNSNIKINNLSVKNKDTIIISPFTKVGDVLSSRSNGNLHNFMKDNKICESNSNIEKIVVENYNQFEAISSLTELNLTKADLINYIDINDEFVSSKNIKLIFDILKNQNKKIMIIFNDVDYFKINQCSKYLLHFNFLYIVNKEEFNFIDIINIEDYILDFSSKNSEFVFKY